MRAPSRERFVGSMRPCRRDHRALRTMAAGVVFAVVASCTTHRTPRRDAANAQRPPAVFTVTGGARCTDVTIGTGRTATNGARIAFGATGWLDRAPADLATPRSRTDAVLRPWRFEGRIGSDARTRVIDAMVLEGPRGPMREGGVRRCAALPSAVPVLAAGLPGFVVGDELVTDLEFIEVL